MWPEMTVAMSRPAVMLAENTSNNLVPAATGIERPVVVPDDAVPIETTPVSGGESTTVAPGTCVKMLVPAGAIYNCPWIVTVDPISATSRLLLNVPAREVIMPSRGTEKAMLLVSDVASINPPNAVIPGAEAPKPSTVPELSRPPNTVVMVAGAPEA